MTAHGIGGFGLVRAGLTNPYRLRSCDGCSHMVGLVIITVLYHGAILARPPAVGRLYQPPPPPEGLGMIESYVGLELIMCGAVDEGDVMLFFIG